MSIAPHKYKIDEQTGCWIWQLALDSWGYGVTQYNKRMILAHRAAWIVSSGHSIPKGMCVLHRCDRPSCINPAHLFLGTLQDNSDDMKRKGRSHLCGHNGEKHPQVKLTLAQVREIRRIGKSEKAVVVGKRYGVNYRTISGIRNNRIWKNVI